MVNSRVAVITGAARGIGWELAKKFAEHGAKVALIDLHQTAVNEAVELLRCEGTEALGVACDVTSEAQLKAAIDQTVQQFERIDIFINNAGLQYVSMIEEFPTEKFEQLIRVMLIAPFMAIKHVFPIMKKQKYGRIINMASINGLVGFAGKAAYNSAKHGVIGLTKVAALEAAPYGITVNALCPGYVDTPLFVIN